MAVAARFLTGLWAVIVESFVAHLLCRRRLSDELLRSLGQAFAWVVWLFVAIRIVDLTGRGDARFLLEPSWNGVLFRVETLPLLIVPSVLLRWRRVRSRRALPAMMAFLVESYGVRDREAALDAEDTTPSPREPARASGTWLGDGTHRDDSTRRAFGEVALSVPRNPTQL